MTWIFLSPHLDDAVFSCGGLIRDLVERGETASIWTVFAGDPPVGGLSEFAQSLHERWDLGREAAALRREEDRRACEIVGAVPRHYELPDCIYRRHPATLQHLYEGDEGIFGEPAAVEVENLVPALAETWDRHAPVGAVFVSPLGLGGHVDHRLIRMAADRSGRPVRYYADTPYVFAWEAMIPALLPEGAEEEVVPVSEAGMRAWTAANAAYESQISTFWGSVEEMKAVFSRYVENAGGVRLWG